MKIVFLDIDGVLNDCYTTDNIIINDQRYTGLDIDKVERINQIIISTEAKIVLSSTWRLYSEFVNYLKSRMKEVNPNLPKVLIDKTKDFAGARGKVRADEIEEWMKGKTDIEKFIVLDDMRHDDLDRFGKSFFLTQYNSGLTEKITNKCIKLLNEP